MPLARHDLTNDGREDSLAANQNPWLWQPGGHCAHLDGVRGLAILLVTVYRFTVDIPSDTWIGGTLHAVLGSGARGVDLFFVLSGFLLTSVLLQTKGGSNYFAGFYWRRSLRIFPLYFATLFACLVLAPAVLRPHSIPPEFEAARQQAWFLWTYTSNIQMSLQGQWCFGAMDHFWSLAIEEHFYLLWPLVIYAFSPRYALAAAVALAMCSATGRILYALCGQNRVATEVGTIFRLDGLCMGGAVAIVAREFPAWLEYRKTLKGTLWLMLSISACLELTGKSLLTLSYTCWALTFVLAIALLISSPSSSRSSDWMLIKPLRRLGRYSYAMYVFQCPQVAIVAMWLGTQSHGASIASVLSYATAMFAINYVAAVASWHLFEKHFLKWKTLLFKQTRLAPQHRNPSCDNFQSVTCESEQLSLAAENSRR